MYDRVWSSPILQNGPAPAGLQRFHDPQGACVAVESRTAHRTIRAEKAERAPSDHREVQLQGRSTDHLPVASRGFCGTRMSERVCDIMVCDAMVRKLVPTARAEMVCRLVTHQGVPQTEVARRLGISRAAISQYVSRKRGCCDGMCL